MSRMTPFFGDISNIISLAITPAFLLLGLMMHIRILNNRLARIIDRSRLLEGRLQSQSGLPAVLKHELSVLYRRMDVIHRANVFAASSVIMVCAVVIALLADDLFNMQLDSLIAFLFIFAMLLLIGSFSLFLHEVFIASHSLPATALHRNNSLK